MAEFVNIEVCVLSREDIIVSKIGRFSEKDREDIRLMMPSAERDLVLELIRDVMARNDLSSIVQARFAINAASWLEEDGCMFAAPAARLVQVIGQKREQFSRFNTFSWELQMSGYPMDGFIVEMTEDMLQQLKLVQMLAGTQYWVDTSVPSEERHLA